VGIDGLLATALTTIDCRIAAQMVLGIGFLCAGVSQHDGFNIRSLNTAGMLCYASAAEVAC
jgi:putative Mg2+ transporter-C (MgtC) family protein